MPRMSRVGFGLVLASGWWLMPAGARAQQAGASVPPASSMMNPFLNPYMNPYINPMATQQPMNGNTALLYLYAANSANGGLGSGRISGTRGGASAKAKVAEMPYTAHPGGGASRYFNPGPNGGGGSGTGRYFNQRGRYFQNNGH